MDARPTIDTEPKGYVCPACDHPTALHRAHGCDVRNCECPAPHGRIMQSESVPDNVSGAKRVDALLRFAEWVVSLDDPFGPDADVDVSQIIQQARKALGESEGRS